MQPISWKPRAFIIHSLITPQEAAHIVQLSWPKMQRSTVVGVNGQSVLDDYRTSYGTFLARYQDEVVAAVQDRVALITHAPVSHQEDMQVLRYGIGQYYKRHHDSLENDSPRMATLLIYLADPEEGGETAFPEAAQWAHPDLAKTYGAEFSQCAQGHVGIRPRQGDALLFWSINPNGKTSDWASMHEGCPVIKGVKWTTTIWIHTVPFRPENFNPKQRRAAETFVDPGICGDAAGSKQCKQWAAAGECEKNPKYMKGTGFEVGQCMRACKQCVVCEEGDQQCYNSNRRRLGFLVFDPRELDYRRAATVTSA